MRTRLLDATIECLVTYGYAGTTTPRVAERAGVTRGAQIHHFRSKEDLVVAAIEHLAQQRAIGPPPERGIQVDEVDPLRAVALPRQGGVARVAVGRLGPGGALDEPDGRPASDIDSRQQFERQRALQ